MKALRAKFVKSTNLEIDKHISKDVYANISFSEIISWTLNKEIWFKTSAIERFSFEDKTKFLSVYTKNNRYDFELEFECEIKFNETLKFHTLVQKTSAKDAIKYITAVSALNIPFQGMQCDWHQVEMLRNNFYQIHPLNFAGAVGIFGDYGIYDNTEFFTNKGFEVSGVIVATSIRALLDILFNAIVVKSAYPKHFKICDYLFDEIDRIELIEKLDILSENLSGDKLNMLLRWRAENEI